MDPSTALYCDVTTGRRGLEFDSETVKLMNYLKEARMPGKYTGYMEINLTSITQQSLFVFHCLAL